MKRIYTIICAAIVICLAATGCRQNASDGNAVMKPSSVGTVETGPDTLKVMTYNLRFGELAAMSDFADFINAESPDIVALQECDWATYRERAPKQNGVKFVNELAYRTGMFGLYGKSMDYKGGYYGIGLLSRYPIVKSERIPLPNICGADGKPTAEPRVMLLAEIELPSGRHVTFVCTHLEVSSSEIRVMQAEFINERMEDVAPALLAGDFNSTPDTPEIAEICSEWKNLTGPDFTISSTEPVKKIDYIFGRPKDEVEMVSTKTVSGVTLSDHLPIVSTVVL